MQKKLFSWLSGGCGAGLACGFLVLLWSAPVLLAGRLWNVLPHLFARNVAETGLFRVADELGRILATPLLVEQGVPSAADGRLSMLYIAWWSQFISWDASALWAVAGAATFAVGLWFFWQAVACRFDKQTAWLSLLVAALLPVYWREAVWFDNYNLSFLWLFAAMAAYCCVKRRWLGLVLAGLCFGLSVSAKDVFLVFVPWLTLTFLWKKEWAKGAVFFLVVAAVYLVPYASDIRQYGYPINQNIARVWPGAEEIANETYLHLYPDPYTYQFAKEEFDAQFVEAAHDKSLSDRMMDEKVILSYGLENGLLRRIRLGFWLLLKDAVSLVQRQTVGGAFIWLFLLPGAVAFYRRDRMLALWLAGLVVSMYIGIRFVLLYERQHLMNIAWILALLGGLGVSQLGQWIAKSAKRVSTPAAVLLLMAVLAMQLVQANRYEFARRYRESLMSETLAMAATVRSVPDDAVVALGVDSSTADRVALLSNRTVVLLRDTTVQSLQQHGGLADAIATYGITHAIGYGQPIAGVQMLQPTEEPAALLSDFASWLINTIR